MEVFGYGDGIGEFGEDLTMMGTSASPFSKQSCLRSKNRLFLLELVGDEVSLLADCVRLKGRPEALVEGT